MRFRYSGWLAYQRSRTPTSGLSRSATAKPSRMRSQRSSAGRARSIARGGSRSFVSCGLAIDGRGPGVGLAAGGTTAGVAIAAGVVAVARSAPALGASCAAGAEAAVAAAGSVFSSAGGLESVSEGMCEHAEASTHIAVAASRLVSFSVNGLAFRPQKPRWYPWFPCGSSKWTIEKDFSQTVSAINARRREPCQLDQNWFFHWRSAANTPAGSLTRLPRYLFADSMTAGRFTRKNGLVAFSRPIVEGSVGRLSRLA